MKLLLLLALAICYCMANELVPNEQGFLKDCIKAWHEPPESWRIDDLPNACSWEGIICSARGLPGEHSITTLSLDKFELRGEIPQSINQLRFLETLNLWHTKLQGNIPNEIGFLPHLRYMNLCCNELTGSIPETLANLKRLRFLRLHENDLSGAIPNNIGELHSLEVMILERNVLSGTLPESLSDMPRLHWLDVRANPMTGCAPNKLNHFMVFCGLEETGIKCEGECGTLDLPDHCFAQCKHNIHSSPTDKISTTEAPKINITDTVDVTPEPDPEPKIEVVKVQSLIGPYCLAAAGGLIILGLLGFLIYVIRRRKRARKTSYAEVDSYSDYDEETSMTDPDYYESDSWDEFEEEDLDDSYEDEE